MPAPLGPLSEAIDHGVRVAADRLQALGINIDEPHHVLQRELASLSAEDRADLVDEGLAASARASRLLQEHDGKPVAPETVAQITADLQASPWDQSALRQGVELQLTEAMDRTYDTTLGYARTTVAEEYRLSAVNSASHTIAAAHAWDQAESAEHRISARVPDLIATLDHLEFSRRVNELRQAGRIDHSGEQKLMDMAEESHDLSEFKTRMYFGGKHLMGETEYRYLDSALSTPPGQRPETWEESEAYVRAFGTGQRLTVERMEQMRQDHQAAPAQTYA